MIWLGLSICTTTLLIGSMLLEDMFAEGPDLIFTLNAPGDTAVCLAASSKRDCACQHRAVIDALGRDRLAQTATHIRRAGAVAGCERFQWRRRGGL
jgi:hypothetical protein